MIYHFNTLNKETKAKIKNVLKNEFAELEEVKRRKNYIELSCQNAITLNDAINKGLYIFRDKASSENNKKHIELNKHLAHFILF